MPRQIKQQIENIIDYRKRTRLPKIEQQIAFLKDVLSKVEKLDSVIATVRYQIEQKNGPYYTMLLADPTMEARFNIVSTTGIKEKLKKQIELLELLKRRFSRDAVSGIRRLRTPRQKPLSAINIGAEQQRHSRLQRYKLYGRSVGDPQCRQRLLGYHQVLHPRRIPRHNEGQAQEVLPWKDFHT